MGEGQPEDEPRRRRLSSVQRMLDLEKKLKMERLKARGPGAKPRPVLLTDPPSMRESPTNTPPTPLRGASPADHGDGTHTEAERARLDQTAGSYSARARESMGTAAASRKTVAFALVSEDTLCSPAASACPSPTWEIHDRHRAEKTKDAAERTSRLRLSKPPPSASRTPQLWAKTSVPLSTPPTDHQRFESYGPPPRPPPKEEKPSKSRKRSDSLGSITSVSSSLTSKIRAFEVPRGRSTARDSGMSFLDGLKPRIQREAEYEWHGRRLAAHNAASYSVPARHLYRQPAGSRLSRQHSRSSSCSIASSDNLANPPALTFPNQRNRGPPVKLRTPRPISRSRSGSLSGSPTGEPHGTQSRASSHGPSSSRNPSRNELDDAMVEGRVRSYHEEAVQSGRSSRASSAPCPRRDARDTFGNYPMNENNPAVMSAPNGKEYPPSASAAAFAYLANLGDEPAEPPRRRRSSLMGRLRGRQPGGSHDSQASDTPSQYSEDMPRAPSVTRSLRDAAKVAFRRSTSRTSSSRRRSIGSDISPPQTATGDTASAFPDLVWTNPTPNAPSPTTPVSRGSGPDPGPGPSAPGDRTLRDAPEVFRHPQPVIGPHTMRPWDHSSISSYETSQSRHLSSTLTPNTSRPQSDQGILSTVGPGDDQKVLGGNDKPSLAPSAMPGAGVNVQGASTPPVRKKSSKRVLRVKVGTETNSSSPKSSNAPGTPMMSSSSSTPTSAAVRGMNMRPGDEPKADKVQPPVRPDRDGTPVFQTPQQPKSQGAPADSPMLPKPLNLSPQTNESMDRVIPHKLRRQAKSQNLNSDDAASNNAPSSEGTPTSHASSPREKEWPLVSHGEVAGNGGSSIPRMRSPPLEERAQRDSFKGSSEADPLSKVLLRCCGCGYFHDVPHRIYERMTVKLEDSLEMNEDMGGQNGKDARCPWCRHALGVKCCAGYEALVQLKERLH